MCFDGNIQQSLVFLFNYVWIKLYFFFFLSWQFITVSSCFWIIRLTLLHRSRTVLGWTAMWLVAKFCVFRYIYSNQLLASSFVSILVWAERLISVLDICLIQTVRIDHGVTCSQLFLNHQGLCFFPLFRCSRISAGNPDRCYTWILLAVHETLASSSRCSWNEWPVRFSCKYCWIFILLCLYNFLSLSFGIPVHLFLNIQSYWKSDS